jgi:hypothetical protein
MFLHSRSFVSQYLYVVVASELKMVHFARYNLYLYFLLSAECIWMIALNGLRDTCVFCDVRTKLLNII